MFNNSSLLLMCIFSMCSDPIVEFVCLFFCLIQDGWTPLHLAVQARRTDLVRLLLIKGADKTLKNKVKGINL
jgi:hypothetical protein